MENSLHAIRCQTCLSIGFTDTIPQPDWSCGICGGKLDYMGQVVENKLKKEVYKAACDKRCTHARGPICWCKCHCENHGTGRVVKVIIESGLPKVEFNDEKALERAREFTLLLAEKEAHIVRELSAGRFAAVEFKPLIEKAKASRQHAARMRFLRKIV